MKYRLFLFLVAFTSASFFVSQSHADDEAQQEEKPLSVYEEIELFTEDFDEASERHFYAIYGSYNLIKVVEEVQAQVGNAIDKCIDANPDMKDALKTRHKDWKAALKPIMKDADANIDNMIKAQEYAQPKELKRILKLNDELRANKEDQVEKYPVTSPEACEYLRVKMDETESNLTQLLRSTLVSLPNALLEESSEEEGAEDQGEDKKSEDE